MMFPTSIVYHRIHGLVMDPGVIGRKLFRPFLSCFVSILFSITSASASASTYAATTRYTGKITQVTIL
jgi:hypothetical protein